MESFITQLSLVFKTLLISSMQISILVCLILAIKALLRTRLTVRWHYWLWLLLLVRMLSPWAPEANFSIFTFVSQAKKAVVQHQPAIASPIFETKNTIPKTTQNITADFPQDKDPVKPTETIPQPIPASAISSRYSFKAIDILSTLWLIVALALAGFALVCNFRLWRIIKSQRPLTESKILDLLEDCKAEMGIQTILGIVVTRKVKSPALFGIIRPRLLLPEGTIETLSIEQLRYVFLHELAHLKRHDIYLGWLMVILQVFHWFNPLVWFAFDRMRIDRELACDSLVLTITGADRSHAYGQTLVNLFKTFSGLQFAPSIAAILENKSQLKRRITMIAKFKKGSYNCSLLAILILATLSCVALTNAQSTKPDEPKDSKKSKFAATLPNGVTVELLGVSEHPSQGKQWWRPDGSNNTFEKPEYRTVFEHSMLKGKKAYDLVFKSNQFGGFELLNQLGSKRNLIPETALQLKTEEGVIATMPNPAHSPDGLTEDLRISSIVVPEDKHSCNVFLGIASGPQRIKSRREIELTGILTSGAIPGGIIWNRPSEPEKGVTAITVLSKDTKSDIRIVAVNKDGEIVVGGSSDYHRDEDVLMINAEFDAPMSEIKEFQYRSRPYEWLEFKNISLKPNLKTNVQIEVENSVAQIETDNLAKIIEPTTLAKEFVQLLIKERFSIATNKFDTTMESAMSAGKLKSTWQSVTSQAGLYDRQLGVRTEKYLGYDIVLVTCQFEKGPLDIKVVYNEKQEISGLFFLPTPQDILKAYKKQQEKPTVPVKKRGELSYDDATSLQALIDSAKRGDTVVVPNGVYTEPVEITKPITLKGQSQAGCIIEVTANKPAILINTGGKGKVKLEGLTIKWQLASSEKTEQAFALGIKDTDVEIKNCNFVPLGNFKRSPVAVRVMGFSNTTINNCQFEGFDYVICYNEGTEGTLRNSLITKCKSQGIILYRGANVKIIGNIITGSSKHAIRSTGGKLDVRNNLIINNANRGIYLGNKSASGRITNNVIFGNATGIGGFANSKVAIHNNIIADSRYAGIGFRKSCRLKIANNIFMGNERGWIMFDSDSEGENGNGCQRNTFWKNKVDAENFRRTANSILADPGFVNSDNGDFSLKPGLALENKQGLTDPAALKILWKNWKTQTVPASSQQTTSTVTAAGKSRSGKSPSGKDGTIASPLESSNE